MDYTVTVDTPICNFCGKGGSVQMSQVRYMLYFGQHRPILEVFEDWTPEAIIQLQTGAHPGCQITFVNGYAMSHTRIENTDGQLLQNPLDSELHDMSPPRTETSTGRPAIGSRDKAGFIFGRGNCADPYCECHCP